MLRVVGGVDVVYDGITNALTAIYPVTCGQTYHIKLAIADVNDKSYDSGVFLEAGSFTSQPPVTITASIADSVITEDCGTTILYFVRPQTQTANPITYHYTISGTATNGVDYTPALPDSIVFPAGQDSVWINITALNDGLAEPLESLTLSLNNVTICGIQVVISFDLHIKDYTPLSTQSTNDTTICIGQSAHIGMTVNEGVPSYAFSWTTNGTNAGNTQALTVTPLSNAWYIANVTDACNKHIKDSIYITVLNNPPLLQDLLPVNACIGRLVEIPTNVTGGINNTYTWNTISGNDSVHQLNPLMAELTYPTIPGNYALVVTNKCGQFDTDTLHIHVEDCTVIYPNIITPNHDGKNDALYFANLDKYPNTALWVYNRWGNKIYESDNYPNNWIPDVSDGTYYYILKFADKTTHSSFVQVSK